LFNKNHDHILIHYSTKKSYFAELFFQTEDPWTLSNRLWAAAGEDSDEEGGPRKPRKRKIMIKISDTAVVKPQSVATAPVQGSHSPERIRISEKCLLCVNFQTMKTTMHTIFPFYLHLFVML